MKWEKTLKKDSDNLGDCKQYNKLDLIPRRHKSTDFLCEVPHTKRRMNKKSDGLLKPPHGQMKNMFHSKENSSKLCAEGAIQNLMNTLHYSTDNINIFLGIGHKFVDPQGIIE